MPQDSSDPLLSATVLLIRDRQNLEVLMVQRHYEIDFAAGALVFPGGKTNSEDESEEWLELIDGDFTAYQRTARVTAIRETFEESGILLGRMAGERGQGAPLIDGTMAAKLAPFRASVDRRQKSFVELIKEHGLVLALDVLIHFGHWITPLMMPKRFDTHFYLAPMPDGQIASHDGYETTHSVWISPQEALDDEASGKATVIFPTRMNLKKLGQAETLSKADAMFKYKPVVTVLPRIGKNQAGEPCLHIPEEAGYDQTTELLSNIKT